MYNVQLDENMFFTGSYAKVGTINNGVNVESLPPSENSLCYKLVDVEVTESRQQPILQYIMRTVSDTEFTTTYTYTETGVQITEEEYNALTDDEKETVTVTQIPVVTTTELTKEEYDALEDKSNVVVSYKTDEDGNLVYETIEETKIVKDWEFSQERYDELEAAKKAEEEAAKSEAEHQQSISNETLANRITELESASATINSMSEAILAGVNEV